MRVRRAPPGRDEVRIEVVAAGLNFIDVTKVMGIYPGLDPADPIQLGIECAGRVAAVGDGVSGFRVGDKVLAITPSMRTTALMASAVNLPAEMVFRKPAHLSFEEAAATPIAFLTAYYSLVELAHIKKGEWVLIHAGAGGVGLAAIEIAKWAGANVIATVGSKEKEEFLRARGIAHVLNSRSLNFADGVMEITGARGVDIVLNSLTGEFIAKGLEVLAPYGRFIELGKRDIYEDRNIGLKVFRKNLSFHAVDLAATIEEKPGYVVELLRTVMGHIESGEWKALPVTSFGSAEPGAPFRYMAQARHIGKISIQHGPRCARAAAKGRADIFNEGKLSDNRRTGWRGADGGGVDGAERGGSPGAAVAADAVRRIGGSDPQDGSKRREGGDGAGRCDARGRSSAGARYDSRERVSAEGNHAYGGGCR